MFSTPLTVNNDPAKYAEREARRELREQREELAARVCPVDPWKRPDVEQSIAKRLRLFAADLIRQRDVWPARANKEGGWLAVAHDDQEIRDLSKEAAELYGPLIDKVLVAVVLHEGRVK